MMGADSARMSAVVYFVTTVSLRFAKETVQTVSEKDARETFIPSRGYKCQFELTSSLQALRFQSCGWL